MKTPSLSHTPRTTIAVAACAIFLLVALPVAATAASNVARVTVAAEVVDPAQVATVDTSAVLGEQAAKGGVTASPAATSAQPVATPSVSVTETSGSLTICVDYN